MSKDLTVTLFQEFSTSHALGGLAGGLKARLETLDSAVERLRAMLKELDEEKQLVTKLLDLENRRAGKTSLPRRRGIAAVVNGALLAGPATKEAMRESAEQSGNASPGRGVNAILMGYVRHGYVVKHGSKYSLTEKGRIALSEKAEGDQ